MSFGGQRVSALPTLLDTACARTEFTMLSGVFAPELRLQSVRQGMTCVCTHGQSSGVYYQHWNHPVRSSYPPHGASTWGLQSHCFSWDDPDSKYRKGTKLLWNVVQVPSEDPCLSRMR